jgi:hypothetical protein
VILLAEHTKDLLRLRHAELVPRPGLALKGKREAVMVFAPVLDPVAG